MFIENGSAVQASERRDDRRWGRKVSVALVTLGLIASVAVAFAPVVGNDFVDWDDYLFIRDNYRFRGLGWEQFRYAWTFHLDSVYLFIPLSVHLFTIEDAVFGTQPHGFHLTGLLLHVANTVALFAVTLALLKRCRPEPAASSSDRSASVWAAGLAVALYALHPLRTELVAWATNQAYMLSCLFMLLSILAYMRANPADGAVRTRWTIAALVLGIAAMLSQPLGVTLAAVLLLLDFYPLRRIGFGRPFARERRRAWMEKAAFLAPAVLVSAMTVWAKGHGDLPTLEKAGLSARLAQVSYGIWFYFAKTVWPTGLTTYYPMPSGVALIEPRFLLAALAIVLTTGVLIYRRNQAPGMLVAWLAYLVLITPYSGLVRYGEHIAADRYCYVPMMAWVAVVAVGLLRLGTWIGRLGRPARPVFLGLAVVGLGLLSTMTELSRRQSLVWRDSVSLWSHALAYAVDCPKLNRCLGLALVKAGQVERGVDYCRKALRMEPNEPEVHAALGGALALLGKDDEAFEHDLIALRLKPNHPEAHANLGASLIRRGKIDEGIAHFEEALRLRPSLLDAQVSLGSALVHRGSVDQGIAHCKAVLVLKPSDAEAHSVLGAAYALKGDADGAIAQNSEALRLNPALVEPRINLAILYAQRGRLNEAATELAEAVRLEPTNAPAHHALGSVLAQSGELDRAAAEFSEVLRLDPNHAQARTFLDEIRGQLLSQENLGTSVDQTQR